MKRRLDDVPTRELVEETLHLARENNRRLRSIQRGQFWGSVFRLIFWAIILGLPVVLYYYFLQPYVEQAMEVYTGIQQTTQDIQEVRENVPEFPSGVLDWFDNSDGNQ